MQLSVRLYSNLWQLSVVTFRKNVETHCEKGGNDTSAETRSVWSALIFNTKLAGMFTLYQERQLRVRLYFNLWWPLVTRCCNHGLFCNLQDCWPRHELPLFVARETFRYRILSLPKIKIFDKQHIYSVHPNEDSRQTFLFLLSWTYMHACCDLTTQAEESFGVRRDEQPWQAKTSGISLQT